MFLQYQGRLVDLINRNKIDISQIETLVLDEADEMLNMGFKDELDASYSNPKSRNTLLFFCNNAKEVTKVFLKRYRTKPIEITIGKRNTGAENISHHAYTVNAKDRYLA